MTKIQSTPIAETNLSSQGDDLAFSNRNALNRVIRCLFAEKIVDPASLVHDPASQAVWLPLWDQKRILLFEKLISAPADTYLNAGEIRLFHKDGNSRPVETASDLLDILMPLFDFRPPETGVDKTKADIENSTVNDAQARSHRAQWNASLRQEIRRAGVNGLVDYMFDTHSGRKASILLDQWGSLEGHPFYPTWKSKPNLHAKEVEQLSPEFGTVVTLRIAALRADMAYMETIPGLDSYHDWFAGHFPDLYADWKEHLEALGKTVSDWLPLPVHSWHLENYVKKAHSADIAAGTLITDGPDLESRPSMSFRTMLPETPEDAPFIKLPIAIWLTSELRGLQAKSINMGPRFSTVIEKILYEEGGFGQALEFLPEDVGFHYKHAERQDDDEGKHLSVVFRSSAKALNREDGLRPVTVAALFAGSPINGRPLVTELVEKTGAVESDQQIADYFRRYVSVVLKPVLSMYLLYGVTLEAHQQNSSILFDADGLPTRLLIRDYGDARAYAPLLEKRGYSIKPYKYGKILPTVFTDSIEPIRSFILDAVFVCHLHEMALMLTREYGVESEQLWHVIGEEADRIFSSLKPRVHDGIFLKEEREIFLHHPWPTRSLLRMHLQEYADYRIQHHLSNPIMKPEKPLT